MSRNYDQPLRGNSGFVRSAQQVITDAALLEVDTGAFGFFLMERASRTPTSTCMLSGLINPGRRLLRLGAAAMLLMPAANAFAGSCKVQNSSPQGQWKFIRAYDGNNGHVVLRQAVNGGDSVEVSVSGTLVRVEFKLPGHTRYKSAPVATCKGGNTIQT